MSEINVYAGKASEAGSCNGCRSAIEEVFVVELRNLMFRLCPGCRVALGFMLRDSPAKKAKRTAA